MLAPVRKEAMEVDADPATDTVNAWVRKLIGTVKDRIVCDTLVESRLKGVNEAVLMNMRVEQLREAHRRLNEDLVDPIPLPTPRFAYARNQKNLVVVSLMQIQKRFSQLAGPSERPRKARKSSAPGHCFIPDTVDQRNLCTRMAPQHAAVLNMSNDQTDYLENLNCLQNGTGKEAKAFKNLVKLAVVAFSAIPEDRSNEVDRALRADLYDAEKEAANDATYKQAVQALRAQMGEEPQAVPEEFVQILDRVASSLADKQALLEKVVKHVPAIVGSTDKGNKKLSEKEKVATFLNDDNKYRKHHEHMRKAVHLVLVDMPIVLEELIEAVSIDAVTLAMNREAYHNKLHPLHTKVYKRIEAAVERNRKENSVPAPKPKNPVGETIECTEDDASERAAELQTLREQRDKAAAQIRTLYPKFGVYATEYRRAAALRRQKAEDKAAVRDWLNALVTTVEKRVTMREHTDARLSGVHRPTEAHLQAAHEERLQKRRREIDMTSVWL